MRRDNINYRKYKRKDYTPYGRHHCSDGCEYCISNSTYKHKRQLQESVSKLTQEALMELEDASRDNL